MKMTDVQIKRMVRTVLRELLAQNAIVLKVSEGQALDRGEETIQDEFAEEADLDRDVHKMLDDLERQSAGEFERHKMFYMLKKRLAEERGFVL